MRSRSTAGLKSTPYHCAAPRDAQLARRFVACGVVVVDRVQRRPCRRRRRALRWIRRYPSPGGSRSRPAWCRRSRPSIVPTSVRVPRVVALELDEELALLREPDHLEVAVVRFLNLGLRVVARIGPHRHGNHQERAGDDTRKQECALSHVVPFRIGAAADRPGGTARSLVGDGSQAAPKGSFRSERSAAPGRRPPAARRRAVSLRRRT